MILYKNYDTPLHSLDLSIKGLDAYPRFTGGLLTDSEIQRNDIVTLGATVPLEMLVTKIVDWNGFSMCTLEQYTGISLSFSQTKTLSAGSDYQAVIREVFGDIVFFEYPMVGKIDKEMTINSGSSRWEIIQALSEEFSFNVKWYESDRLYMVKPKTSHPIRTLNSSVYEKYANQELFNHVTITNEKNESIEVFTEDYFIVGANKMTPLSTTVVSDRYNMIKYGERVLKKERQTKCLMTGALPIAEYPEIVNEIGELWVWNGRQCRIRSIEVTGNSFVCVAGQENEEMLSFDLDSERELRGLPLIWLW